MPPKKRAADDNDNNDDNRRRSRRLSQPSARLREINAEFESGGEQERDDGDGDGDDERTPGRPAPTRAPRIVLKNNNKNKKTTVKLKRSTTAGKQPTQRTTSSLKVKLKAPAPSSSTAPPPRPQPRRPRSASNASASTANGITEEEDHDEQQEDQQEDQQDEVEIIKVTPRAAPSPRSPRVARKSRKSASVPPAPPPIPDFLNILFTYNAQWVADIQFNRLSVKPGKLPTLVSNDRVPVERDPDGTVNADDDSGTLGLTLLGRVREVENGIMDAARNECELLGMDPTISVQYADWSAGILETARNRKGTTLFQLRVLPKKDDPVTPFGFCDTARVLRSLLEEPAERYFITVTAHLRITGGFQQRQSTVSVMGTPTPSRVTSFTEKLAQSQSRSQSQPRQLSSLRQSSTPATPTIAGSSTPVSSSRQSTAPASTSKQSVKSNKKKTTTNSMVEELMARRARDREEARQGKERVTLIYEDLGKAWGCDKGRECKNYRKGNEYHWCFLFPNSKHHYPLTPRDLIDWAHAIAHKRATTNQPPASITGRWFDSKHESSSSSSGTQMIQQSNLQPFQQFLPYGAPGSKRGGGGVGYMPMPQVFNISLQNGHQGSNNGNTLPATAPITFTDVSNMGMGNMGNMGMVAEPTLPTLPTATATSSRAGSSRVGDNDPLPSSPPPSSPPNKPSESLVTDFMKQLIFRHAPRTNENQGLRDALFSIQKSLISGRLSLHHARDLPKQWYLAHGVDEGIYMVIKKGIKEFLHLERDYIQRSSSPPPPPPPPPQAAPAPKQQAPAPPPPETIDPKLLSQDSSIPQDSLWQDVHNHRGPPPIEQNDDQEQEDDDDTIYTSFINDDEETNPDDGPRTDYDDDETATEADDDDEL